MNAGEITSNGSTVAAVDGGAAFTGYVLRNSGTILGLGDAVEGSAFKDIIVNTGILDGTVRLGGGDDAFRGGAGRALNFIDGGNGNDIISSGLGDNAVLGGAGNDRLAGNDGDDDLTGGSGSDQFIFQRGDGNDTITDFTNGIDALNLRAFHLASFSALSGLSQNVAGGMHLNLGAFGGGTIMLEGFSVASFNVADVIL